MLFNIHFENKSKYIYLVIPLFILIFFSSLVVANPAHAEDLRNGTDYSGLYKTGVNSSGNKLGYNEPDPHWTLSKIYNVAGLPTCQDNPTTNKTVYYPNSPATTVVERGDGGVNVINDNGLMIGVGYSAALFTYDDHSWVWWTQVNPSARWISQNMKGRHFHTVSCPDPSYNGGNITAEKANVFVFTLKNIAINNNKIDLNSIGLFMNIDADNWVSVSVNGNLMTPTSPTINNTIDGKKWVSPDFTTNETSRFEWAASPGVFKQSGNTIEVHVLSTLTNVGMIVTNIGLTGSATEPPPSVASECWPRKYSVSVSSDYYGVVPVVVTANYIDENGAYHSDVVGVHSSSVSNVPIDKKYSTSHNLTFSFRDARTRYKQIVVVYAGCSSYSTGTGEDTVTHTFCWPTKYAIVTDAARSYSPMTVGPCYNYRLKTDINLTSATNAVEVGTGIMTSTTLTDRPNHLTELPHIGYPHTRTKVGVESIVTKLIYSSQALSTVAKSLGNQHSDNSPCSQFSPDLRCTSVSSKTYSSPIAVDATMSGNANSEVDDVPAGSDICFVHSTRYFSSESTGNGGEVNNEDVYYHSKVVCHTVYKKPRVQIWGGDLITGRSFGSTMASANEVSTSTSIKSGRMYGSWVEYGIFASGTVSGMGSGSAFVNSLGLNVSNQCDYSKLTFANTKIGSTSCTNTTALGNYSSGSTIPDVSATFPTSIANSLNTSDGVDLSNVATGVYTTNSDFTIKGSSITLGKWIVINAPNSTVTITGDINYSNEFIDHVNKIPQVVIIAKNINIIDNVGNIDSWLIAKNGYVNTCSSVPNISSLTTVTCSKQLIVHGPVMAKKLYLRRTYGSGVGTNSGEPAEIFDLRTDAYLWAANRAKDAGSIQTVYTFELPPRF
ncbi:MAG: hypothetical protein PWQ10_109 [Patescibacteria group bacterium]|nr:hypothetical protein [Patescibacteria group bacterium]